MDSFSPEYTESEPLAELRHLQKGLESILGSSLGDKDGVESLETYLGLSELRKFPLSILKSDLVAQWDRGSYLEQQLLIQPSALLSEFSCRVLFPKKRTHNLVVLSLHGHGRNHLGSFLAENGFICYAPLFTSYGSKEEDQRILLDKFNITLMGFRIHLLDMLGAYLQATHGPSTSIVMVGHSGGASLGRLFCLCPSFKVLGLAVDLVTDWKNDCANCEFHPQIPARGWDLNFSVRELRVEYGFEGAKVDLLAFFQGLKNVE